ncbi:MAG: DUF5722 domain-containing protein [Thermoleophilia bacterium]|nr:DUF5722 domain-containing protein [Thermoleophilia bacterium]MDH4346804.1 DUF5722 domain-containing protein [Thermoleophilia bacterium]
MRRLALLLATAVYAVALVLAPTADASRFLRIGIYDDAEILFGNPDYVFPILQQMSTKLIRANLRWGGPNGVANTRPGNPSDPADPAYDWSAYDRTVLRGKAIGAEVMLSIVGTPSWANGGRPWNTAPTKAIDLRRFAVAAARRYNGTFVGPDGRLPAVRLWLAWNEPNNPVFLQPQYAQVGSRWVLQSAKDYARICDSIASGVKSIQRKARVACGVTAPRGNNNPTSNRPSSSPITFLRAMKAAGASGFDAYAHHPYYGTRNETPSTPPPQGARGQAATAVTLGNFEVLAKEVKRLYGNVRLWVTEYGYQTSPPDRLFGVTWANQANYMREAYLKLRANPKVDVFVWFLLRDEARLGGWQSGVYTRRYIRKDAREVFEQISSGRIR